MKTGERGRPRGASLRPTPRAAARGLAWPAAVLAAVLFVLTGQQAIRGHSLTSDEGVHLVSGLAYLLEGDLRLNSEVPPTAKVVAALACLPLRPRLDTSSDLYRTGEQWGYARHVLFRDNDGDRLVARGRSALLLASASLLLLLFGFSLTRFGPIAALTALVMVAFDPGFLGHAPLVTTDVTCALALSLAVAAYTRALERPSLSRVLLAAVGAAAALTLKYTSLILVPLLGCLTGLRLLEPGNRARRLPGLAALLALVLAGAYLGIWLGYGLEANRLPAAPGHCDATRYFEASRRSLPKQALAWIHDSGLLPHAYTEGLQRFVALRTRWSYLGGEGRVGGWRSYYLIAFLLKTPPASLLALLLAGLWLAWRRPPIRPGPLLDQLLLGLAYLGLAILGSGNIGIRHVLPVLPPLCLGAGVAAAAAARRHPRATGLLLGALGLSLAASTLTITPHQIAYFNFLAGGPARGSQWLVDSNLDWGQDLGRLGKLLRRLQVPRVYLEYFGPTPPEHYGISALPFPAPGPDGRLAFPPGSWVAISEQRLAEARTTDRLPGVWEALKDRTPVARAGFSIRVYRW